VLLGPRTVAELDANLATAEARSLNVARPRARTRVGAASRCGWALAAATRAIDAHLHF
jgi:hypothetical protein